MPLCRLDVSLEAEQALSSDESLRLINETVSRCLAVELPKVKTFVVRHGAHRVGADQKVPLVALTVQCFTGRSETVRARLSLELYQTIEAATRGLSTLPNISVYVVEVDPAVTTTALHKPQAQ